MKKIYNPYSGELLSSLNFSTKYNAQEMIDASVKAKSPMASLSSFDKFTILQTIITGIESRKDEFVKSISSESGKPYRYATAEVDRAIATFQIASEECKRFPHELIDVDATEKGRGVQGIYRYFPAGIVFGIAPFNFPLNLAVHKIAPAIAAGCPIILKPSSKTPLTMELLKEVIDITDLPEGGFQLLHCSREVGDFVLKHPEIQVLSFTGSPEVGWKMKSDAGNKKVVLELGGNAAAIVCSDAVLDDALDQLVIGGFAYSGQVCIHTQRIYVEEASYAYFVERFIQKSKELIFGDPIERDTEFSVMIDEENAKRIEAWVNEATDAGAKVLLGGKRDGAFYPPTILSNVAKGLKILEEEAFGPVVIIESFRELERAIGEVNDSRWGLQASIFTDSISKRNYAFQKLNVGGVMHNLATTFRVDEMPYGGVKDSGFGREGVKYAMLDYLEGKLLIEKVNE